MIARSAGDDDDPLEGGELGIGDLQLLELGGALGEDAADKCVGQCPGLLVYLLRHEVFETVPERGAHAPRHPHGRRFHGRT